MEMIERVQIVVEVTEPDGTVFRDAIYMTAAERAAQSGEQLQALGQARFDAWKARVIAPPHSPTPEEVLAGVDALVLEADRLDVQVAALTRAEYDAARVRVGLAPVTRTR